MYKTSTFVLVGMLVAAACNSKKAESLTPEERKAYEIEMADWYQSRQQALTADDGWLNLAGLFWLHEGINSFGSSAGNDLVFPLQLPEKAGFFKFMDGKVEVLILPDVDIFNNGRKVLAMKIFDSDSIERSAVLSADSLRWNVIKRGDKVGIRLRDLESKQLKTFEGNTYFDLNPEYRVQANWISSDTLKTIDILNVLGQTTATSVPGILEFTLQEKTYRLVPVEEGDMLFIIFADATNGLQTYASGRYLYATKPDATGKVLLDFNKSINPPCVYTEFATCPLPPKHNILPIQILAGEKVYGVH